VYGIDPRRRILAVDPHDATLLAGALIGAVFEHAGPFERFMFSLTKHQPIPETTGEARDIQIEVEQLPHLLLQLVKTGFEKDVFTDAFDLARLLDSHSIPFTFADLDEPAQQE